MNPDVLCFQETKASTEEVKSTLELLPEYKSNVNSCKTRKGYSGTSILTKGIEPLNVTCDMGVEEHDQEGRVMTAEFNDFYLVTVYVPNAGEGLKRLDYRQKWDEDFRKYLVNLQTKKPISMWRINLSISLVLKKIITRPLAIRKWRLMASRNFSSQALWTPSADFILKW